MSADRELLEWAAKAAGLDVEFMPISGANIVSGPRAGLWNPLTDDGDALRLAVKLRIRLNWGANHDVVRVDYVLPENWPAVPMYESVIGGDIEAATRRAIVRAAAEIGRTL